MNDLQHKVDDVVDDIKDAGHKLHDEALKQEGRLDQRLDDMKDEDDGDGVMGNPGGKHDSIADTTDRK